MSVLVIRFYKVDKYVLLELHSHHNKTSIVITYKGLKFTQQLTCEDFILQQMSASEKAQIILFKNYQYSESRVLVYFLDYIVADS